MDCRNGNNVFMTVTDMEVLLHQIRAIKKGVEDINVELKEKEGPLFRLSVLEKNISLNIKGIREGVENE